MHAVFGKITRDIVKYNLEFGLAKQSQSGGLAMRVGNLP
jgi:hypothetical protein